MESLLRFLFHKKLSESDRNALCKITLPKKDTEEHFIPYLTRQERDNLLDGVQLSVYCLDRQQHLSFTLKSWKSSPTYNLVGGWTAYARERMLRKGDFVAFWRFLPLNKICISTVYIQPSHAVIVNINVDPIVDPRLKRSFSKAFARPLPLNPSISALRADSTSSLINLNHSLSAPLISSAENSFSMPLPLTNGARSFFSMPWPLMNGAGSSFSVSLRNAAGGHNHLAFGLATPQEGRDSLAKRKDSTDLQTLKSSMQQARHFSSSMS